jgi:tRNA(Ile)-lysidine synthetase-like protein
MTRARSSRSGFEQRLLKTMRELDVLSGRRLTVGFSGGTDSLALAAALSRIAPVLGVDLRLVHVDHLLRPGSASDAEACKHLAQRLKLPNVVVALDAGLPERSKGIGIEEAARRERYLALAEAAAGWDSNTILLAHQANDQAETMLMHLFRGSGLDGLAGMRTRETRTIPWWPSETANVQQMTLIRPLLAETRATIERYLAATGLTPVEDDSNASNDYDRNWVRNVVLPSILQRWPAAIETMQRSAAVIEIDQEYIESVVDASYNKSANADRTLCTDDLKVAGRSTAYRVLRRWLESLDLPEIDLGVVERLYALALDQDELRAVEVGIGMTVVLADGHLMTFGSLCRRAAATYPIVCDAGEDDWEMLISTNPQAGDHLLEVPGATKLLVRTIERGDRWFRSDRSVAEDLRRAGIHPLLRTRLLAVAGEDGVLLIPAIYPTIHISEFDGPVKKVGVRWRKRS